MTIRSTILLILSLAALAMAGSNKPATNLCSPYKNQQAKGFCNAYCYAQKCATKTKKSCTVLKNKFINKTGEARLPCDPTQSPSMSPSAAPSVSAQPT
jgi:hypothetical protein